MSHEVVHGQSERVNLAATEASDNVSNGLMAGVRAVGAEVLKAVSYPAIIAGVGTLVSGGAWTVPAAIKFGLGACGFGIGFGMGWEGAKKGSPFERFVHLASNAAYLATGFVYQSYHRIARLASAASTFFAARHNL